MAAAQIESGSAFLCLAGRACSFSLVFDDSPECRSDIAPDGVDPGQQRHPLGPRLRPGDVGDVGEGRHVEGGSSTQEILRIFFFFDET